MTKIPKEAKVLEVREGVTVIEMPPHPKAKYPLWNIESLQENINQAEANIMMFEEHIIEQKKVIKERKEQIAVCLERDRKIAEWEKMMAQLEADDG